MLLLFVLFCFLAGKQVHRVLHAAITEIELLGQVIFNIFFRTVIVRKIGALYLSVSFKVRVMETQF